MSKPLQIDDVAVVVQSDAELVQACALNHSEDAFSKLVQRHGRTVLAVCRGILGDSPDVDDAFQATFLILLRRADRIRQPDAIGSWLCGVATHVAKRQRQQRTQIQTKEVAMTVDPSPITTNVDPAVEALDSETRALIWTELGELPEKYRDVMVLCHFDGHTTEQAAELLQCPVGTVRSRLLKARELLRTRLVRRGVTMTSAALVAWIVTDRAAATPPPQLLQKTTQAATDGASATVAAMTDRTMRELSPRWKWPFGITLGLILVLMLGLFLSWNRQPVNQELEVARKDAVNPPATRPGTLLVVSQQDANVTIINAATGRTLATIPTDPSPHEVAISPNGRLAAVANYGLPFGQAHGSTVTLIDVAAGKKLRTVEVGGGAAPHGLCWLNDERLLCTVEAIEAIVEIDVQAGKVARTIRTAQAGSHMVAASGDRAFTTNVFSGSVSKLDTKQGLWLDDRKVGNAPEGIALSPNGKQLWVGNRADNTISVLATDDLSVIKTVPVPGMPLRLAFTPDGRSVLVVAAESGILLVFDVETMTERRRVKKLPNPATLAISPDSRTAYCTLFTSQAVAVIDLTTGVVIRTFEISSRMPDGIAYSPISPNEDNP
jgi:RNA polymerase sigma factor (sigma-70 family)